MQEPNVARVNRTDRLYAIVEDLRAVAPRTRSARWLAERYEVSVRTIERDLGALLQAGVPIHSETGRAGGYGLDKAMTLPPLNFTPAEAVAVAVALHGEGSTPLHRAARSALRKIMAAMPAQEASAAAALADRVRFLAPLEDVAEREAQPDPAAVPAVIEDALVRRRVLRLAYCDKQGVISEREIEPVAFLAGMHGWYLSGWCRLRAEMRVFRIDRVLTATDTGEPVPARLDHADQWSNDAYTPRFQATAAALS